MAAMADNDDSALSDEGTLCTTCAMCCDGTLFGVVPVVKDEVDSVAHLFPLEVFGDQTGFTQPCQYCAQGGCAVYIDRPKTCRSYACVTLKAMRKGEIDFATARSRVTAVQQVLSTMAAAVGPEETVAAFRIRARNAPDFRTLSAENPKACMQLGILQILLDRHFRSDTQKIMAHGDTMTAD
jgi:Fe-S-cluster containining protein